MMNDYSILIDNMHKIHTTENGKERMRVNIKLNHSVDPVEWCKAQILLTKNIIRNGKNWYVKTINNEIIVINASSYTIITAHKY